MKKLWLCSLALCLAFGLYAQEQSLADVGNFMIERLKSEGSSVPIVASEGYSFKDGPLQTKVNIKGPAMVYMLTFYNERDEFGSCFMRPVSDGKATPKSNEEAEKNGGFKMHQTNFFVSEPGEFMVETTLKSTYQRKVLTLICIRASDAADYTPLQPTLRESRSDEALEREEAVNGFIDFANHHFESMNVTQVSGGPIGTYRLVSCGNLRVYPKKIYMVAVFGMKPRAVSASGIGRDLKSVVNFTNEGSWTYNGKRYPYYLYNAGFAESARDAYVAAHFSSDHFYNEDAYILLIEAGGSWNISRDIDNRYMNARAKTRTLKWEEEQKEKARADYLERSKKFPFDNQLVRIEQDGQQTLIDSFQTLVPFNEHVLAYQKYGLWGLVDAQGNTFAPPYANDWVDFQEVTPELYSLTKGNSIHFYHVNGKDLALKPSATSVEEDVIIFNWPDWNRFEVYDFDLNKKPNLIPEGWTTDLTGLWKNEITDKFYILKLNPKGNSYGTEAFVYSRDGDLLFRYKTVQPIKYLGGDFFSYERKFYSSDPKERGTGVGVLNSKGEEVIPAILGQEKFYSGPSPGGSFVMMQKKKDKYSYVLIDQAGEITEVSGKYDNCSGFYEEGYARFRKAGKDEWVNVFEDGHTEEADPNEFINSHPELFTIRTEKKKMGVANQKGDVLIPFEYESIETVGGYKLYQAKGKEGESFLFLMDGTHLPYHRPVFNKMISDSIGLCFQQVTNEGLLLNVYSGEPIMEKIGFWSEAGGDFFYFRPVGDDASSKGIISNKGVIIIEPGSPAYKLTTHGRFIEVVSEGIRSLYDSRGNLIKESPESDRLYMGLPTKNVWIKSTNKG